MRAWVFAVGLCIFFFFLPLQCYVIGNGMGMGIQGAVYRYQITGYGNSLIPVVREIEYITSGIYTGKDAYSVILWLAGSVVLALVTIFSLIRWDMIILSDRNRIQTGLGLSVLLYLGSCIARYGLFFSGPAGLCIPAGIVILVFAVLGLHYLPPELSDEPDAALTKDA